MRSSKQGRLTWIVLLGLWGCGSEPEAEASAPDPRQDALPAAIVGEAGPLRGESVGYFSDDPAAQGYLSVPAGEGPFPAVILIHEWNGLVDRIRETADALADEGYVALAADLYSGRTGTNRDENIALMSGVQSNPEGNHRQPERRRGIPPGA